MAIKTNYNFKGIIIPDAYIRIDRLFGSSKEGWNSLVGVYNTTIETVPAVEEITEQRLVTEATEDTEAVYETVIVTEAQEATTKEVVSLIEEFNHQASYKEDERGYVTIYKSLTDKYGGVEI